LGGSQDEQHGKDGSKSSKENGRELVFTSGITLCGSRTLLEFLRIFSFYLFSSFFKTRILLEFIAKLALLLVLIIVVSVPWFA
jgi:hypothetical protein